MSRTAELDEQQADRVIGQLVVCNLERGAHRARAIAEELAQTWATTITKADAGNVEDTQRTLLGDIKVLEHTTTLSARPRVEAQRIDRLIRCEHRTDTRRHLTLHKGDLWRIIVDDNRRAIPQIDAIDLLVAVEALHRQLCNRLLIRLWPVDELQLLQRRVERRASESSSM